MDLPQPPQDVELKNIIDKLAQFVARNGPEFEQMTKNKQKDNPKFSFLFGGDMYNYYQYKVTTEQAILKLKAQTWDGQNQSSSPAPPPLPSMANIPPPTMTPMQIINAAAANTTPWQLPPLPPSGPVSSVTIPLSAIVEQQTVLQQQIVQSEQNLAAQQASLLESETAMIEDIVRKYQTELLNQRAIELGISLTEMDSILQPIIDSCTKDSISSGKAWILNHSTNAAHQLVTDYLLHKVLTPNVPFTHKLHIIYLVNDVMHHCVRKNATDLKKSVERIVVAMFCNTWVSGNPDQREKLKKLLNLWETKNTYFSPETIKKMKTPEESWEEHQEEVLRMNEEIILPAKVNSQNTYENYKAQHQMFVNHALNQIQTLESQKMQLEQQEKQLTPPEPPPPPMIREEPQGICFNAPPPFANAPPPPPPVLFSHLPPELLPDFSRPPPGFPPPLPEVNDDELIPTVPYYELPAGLMVPLVSIDDFSYKPLDPSKLRLPPAIPPSDRLMQAVESFYQKSYSGSTRERLILDADGWEKLGLYEYYKEKNAAKKKREMEIEAGLRDRSRSPTPIRRERSRSRTPKKKRCYRSKSPSPVQAEARRSPSRSPPRQNRNGRRSPRRPQRNNRRSRSKSPSPPARTRSPTPPSFLGGAYGKTMEEKLDESNKGHQMLRKMGWGGAGLGSKEQGIEAPISGGEVRDRTDLYKGVGVNLHDPYESFRKNKGKAFVTRMKARAEERSSAP